MLKDHQNIIHKICMMYTRNEADHEDLFQEVVFQAWKSFESFKGDSKLSTWLYRVSLYTALTHKRKKNADMGKYGIELEYTQIDDNMENDIKKLYSIVDELSTVDKAVVTLYLDSCSYEEMADIMGTTVNNIGVRINRIKKKLKEKWN